MTKAMNFSDPSSKAALEQAISAFNQNYSAIEHEVGRAIVGMRDVVNKTLSTIFAGGHVLLEGVPGLGKTRLVKSISNALGLPFRRIQFTPDLMPSDVTGTEVLTEDEHGRRQFVFKPGPVFASILLADEINRATPKTQAALLEAMEERQVTVLGHTHLLPEPFFVLATQNPVELEGTYPLPEAQLDRFMVKVLVPAPHSNELKQILDRTTGVDIPEAKQILGTDSVEATIEAMKRLVRQVVVADPMKEVLVRMMAALTPCNEFATEKVKRYVRFGPGPRGAQALMMIGKVSAILDGRINLSFEDLRNAILPTLRHRLILNFQAEADGVSSDDIISEVKNAR